MAEIDLLLVLDDGLMKHVGDAAVVSGMSVEEWVRQALMANVGLPYTPLSADADRLMRPVVTLDLSA